MENKELFKKGIKYISIFLLILFATVSLPMIGDKEYGILPYIFLMFDLYVISFLFSNLTWKNILLAVMAYITILLLLNFENIIYILYLLILLPIIFIPKILETIFNIPREKYSWDKPSKFYFYISMFIPVVGFIMWCVFVNHKPNSARSAGRGALCSVLFFILFMLCLRLINYSVSFVNNNILVEEYTNTYNIHLNTEMSDNLDKYDFEMTVTYTGNKEYLDRFKEMYEDEIFPDNQLSIDFSDIKTTNNNSYDLIPYIENYIDEFFKNYITIYKNENSYSSLEYIKYKIKEKEIIVKELVLDDEEILLNYAVDSFNDYNGVKLKAGDKVDVYLIDEENRVFVKIINNSRLLSAKNDNGENITYGIPSMFILAVKEKEFIDYRNALTYTALSSVRTIIIKHDSTLSLNNYEELESIDDYNDMRLNSNEVPTETFGIIGEVQE